MSEKIEKLEKSEKPEKILEFKSNLPNITVVKLYSGDNEKIKQTLKKQREAAPMMFAGLRVIVDISDIEKPELDKIDFKSLKQTIINESIYPVAIISDYKTCREKSIQADMGALPVIEALGKENKSQLSKQMNILQENNELKKQIEELKAQKEGKETEEPKKTYSDNNTDNDEDTTKSSNENFNKVLTHAVRSGQRVYSKGDLTIIGNVSPGAEVIAEGNIHIYGSLRGRAIAGASGNEDSLIFCLDMNAELVSIAGNYKQIEFKEQKWTGKKVQISLQDNNIKFFNL